MSTSPPETLESRRRAIVARLIRLRNTMSATGLVVALFFLCASMAPSLIPRAWYFQGLTTGLSAVAGYGIGATVGWFFRWLGFRHTWGAQISQALWRLLALTSIVAVPIFVALGAHWQTELRRLFGMSADGPQHIIAQAVIALSLALGLLYAARGLRKLAVWGSRRLSRWIPRRAAVLASTIIVAFVFVQAVNGTVLSFALRTMNDIYANVDTGYPPGVDQPVAEERSGSQASESTWDSLGLQGRKFVGTGPTRDELTAFAGEVSAVEASEVRDPIRVYAGLAGVGTLEGAAQRVVQELDRTNAWDREALMIVTSTGTGWVQPAMADTFEYLHGGDTAIASMQYSYLPSWVSFVSDRDTPPAAGKELFEEIYAAWLKQPEDSRPRLYVAGLSLGSYGMQGAFSGLQDMTQRTDGALFVGTPSFTPNWSFITNNRDPGSTMNTPVFDQGRTVRFSSTPRTSQGLWDLQEPWTDPKVVYLQHASDAVVWWSPDLLFEAPDWLHERAGVDRRVDMVWLPVVTFAQVTFDMAVSGDVPTGHGHQYHGEYVDALAAVTLEEQWSANDLDTLRNLILG
ncbi:alpha/beta hydrolase [Jonesia quinghaiensis]|uniref:alpha/beta hydrolase n=1 Tax=Jonesia quinghaiensis TaxID=262806 RepID=UPI000403F2AC|nr:alpha/beta-hydrolase family protein [Jonesia quinghaiensis]